MPGSVWARRQRWSLPQTDSQKEHLMSYFRDGEPKYSPEQLRDPGITTATTNLSSPCISKVCFPPLSVESTSDWVCFPYPSGLQPTSAATGFAPAESGGVNVLQVPLNRPDDFQRPLPTSTILWCCESSVSSLRHELFFHENQTNTSERQNPGKVTPLLTALWLLGPWPSACRCGAGTPD